MWKPSTAIEQKEDIAVQQEALVENRFDEEKLAMNVVRKITDFKGTPDEVAIHNEMLASCTIGEKKAQEYVKAMIRDALLSLSVPFEKLEYLTKKIYEDYYGLGPIEDLFQDPTVNEIWVNGAEHIWIERDGKKIRIPRRFTDDQDVLRVIRLILQYDHQEVNRQKPIAESRMADGSRVTVVVPEVAKRPYINIRKFQAFQVTEENLLKAGTMTKEIAAFLKVAVKGRSNILLIGETGSGKTSFLQYLVSLMNPELRIGTIETKFELKLDEKFPDRNIFCYETKEDFGIEMSDLFKVVLRSSPDIIIVGEARGEEANDLINAMRRGHPGSCSTIHTNSAETAIDDLADMINMDGKRRDPIQLRHRIATAIDLIIQIHRFEETGVRRLIRISEILPDKEGKSYKIQDLFYYNFSEDEGTFVRTEEKVSSKLKRKWMMYGVTQEEISKIGV